jgi:hypothetical protein
MKVHRYIAIAGTLAAAFTLAGPTYGQFVQIPTNYSTPLYNAAEKFVEDMHINETTGTWQILPLDPPYPTGFGVYVSISSTFQSLYNLDPTGYKFQVLPGSSGDGIRILTPTEEGAIDGMHSLRLHYQSLGLNGNGKPEVPRSMNKRVNPAFERRGFLVIPDEVFSFEQWKDYIDSLRLLGANTLTVGLTTFYDDQDPKTHNSKYEYEELALAMGYCQTAGVRFQLIVAPNAISDPLFWDEYLPEPGTYDGSGTFTSAGLGGGESIGAESDHGDDEHELLYFPPSASFADVVDADLDADQTGIYTLFKDADAFVVMTTREAADYSPEVMANPLTNWIDKGFDQVQDMLVQQSSAADVAYWGWLHDLWFRWQLSDPDYMDSDHTGLATWETGSHDRIGTQGPGIEWIQEVGAHYSQLDFFAAIVAVVDSSTLDDLVDPLGRLDGLGFDITAFLYWCHEESDGGNFLLRPAIRATITDLRAALRMKTDGIPADWGGALDAKEPATGVLGYRYGSILRRPLNDYVVLRCAGDDTFLDVDDPDINSTGLGALRDLIIPDLAKFISPGAEGSALNAVTFSLSMLDDARKLFSPTDMMKLEQSLQVFKNLEVMTPGLMGDVPWWEDTPRLEDYYHLLAFALYAEQAAAATDGTVAFNKALKKAKEVATRSELLAPYATGHEAQIHGAALALIVAIRGS